MSIRPFQASDNAALQEMEKLCEQGDPQDASWYAVFDDFTKRAAKYKDYSILVLETMEDSSPQVVGTASVGIKEVQFGNHNNHDDNDTNNSSSIFRIGHCFNLRMHPNYRGRGLAKQLVQERRRIAAQAGCTLLYGTIAPTNHASIALFRATRTWKVDAYSIQKWMEDHGTASISGENGIQCQKLDPSRAMELMTQYHGTKPFFPQDMENVLKSPHCFGSWQATKGGNNDQASFAFFSIWDSASSFQWQITLKGQPLPICKMANFFGLVAEGTAGMDCLTALMGHVQTTTTTALANHQRFNSLLAHDDPIAKRLRDEPEQYKPILEYTTSLSLCIAPTSDRQVEKENSSCLQNKNEIDFFCDPRDY